MIYIQIYYVLTRFCGERKRNKNLAKYNKFILRRSGTSRNRGVFDFFLPLRA